MTISIISTFRLISVEEIFRKPTDHTFLSLCTVTLCHFISLIDVYDQSILISTCVFLPVSIQLFLLYERNNDEKVHKENERVYKQMTH